MTEKINFHFEQASAIEHFEPARGGQATRTFLSMQKYFKIYSQFFRVNLLKSLAYRGNFILGLILVIFESMTTLLTIKIVFSHLHSIENWSYSDMLVLSGTFMITNALAWLLFKSGINNLDRLINQGQLDGYLVKPVDTQFLITVYDIDIEDAARSFVGIALLAIGLRGVGIAETLLRLPTYIFLLLLGQIIIYSISLSIKTISFKSIQGWATNAISWRFHDLARYPTDIYRGIMRIIYTFVFPLAFIATVPSKALLGRVSPLLFVGAILAAGFTFAISRLIWKWALKTYSSASS